MQSYSLAIPPDVPGIYALRHKPTGKIYIGKTNSLAKRHSMWRHSITHGRDISLRFSGLTGEHCLLDWEFLVIAAGGELDLTELEHRAIMKASKDRPEKLLNSTVPSPTDGRRVRKTRGPAAKSKIFHEGRQVTYQEAAEIMGNSYKALAKRLAKYRARGIDTVTVEELKAMSKKYSGA